MHNKQLALLPAIVLFFVRQVSAAEISGSAGKGEDKSAGIINVAPYAAITTDPFCGTLQYLIDGEVPATKGGTTPAAGGYYEMAETQADGNIATFASFPIRASHPRITFTFSSAVHLKQVRFFQRGAYSKSYRLEGDMTGNGDFRNLLERKRACKPDSWEDARVDAPGLFALRFVSTEESGRGGPQIGEFQVFVTSKSAEPVLRRYRAAAARRADVPEVAFGAPMKIVMPDNVPQARRHQLGATCCLWMFIDQTDPYAGTGINPKTLAAIKGLGLDRVRLFAGLRPKSMEKITLPADPVYRSRIYPGDVKLTKRYAGIGTSCVPWPSKVLIGYKDNVLRRFAGDMQANNLGVCVIPPRNVPPFDVRPGYYPMSQADRHDKRPDKRFPCVLHGGYWVPAFSQILGEIAGAGVTGVDVTPDEFYVSIHDLQRMPGNDPCRRLFKQKYGLDVPERIENTEQYRKWLLFQAESTADAFKRLADAARKANPGIELETNLSVAPLLFYNSLGFGIALDIAGHAMGVDRFGTDPYYRLDTLGHYQMPKTALLFQGATPSRETVMMLQAVCGDFRTPLQDPVWAAGNATSVLMRGVHAIDFYRLNYYANTGSKGPQNPAYPFYKNWIAMVRRLEVLGLKAARVPRDVALVYSRASQDWWELKEKVTATRKNKGRYAYPNSAMAGYVALDAVMLELFKGGYPTSLYYLDQPATLQKVLDYKVIVIPFAYSVSIQSAAILKQALARGARILLVKHLGQTNEFGTPYPEPILRELVKRPGVTYLDLDLLRHGNDPAVQRKFTAALDRLLAQDQTFRADTHGKDVEASILRHEDGTTFIGLVNWHNQPAMVDLSLKCAPGQYSIQVYGLDGVCATTLQGRAAFPADALRLFRVKMAKHETLILVVKGQPAARP